MSFEQISRHYKILRLNFQACNALSHQSGFWGIFVV
ncbi:hypothetical protein HH_1053 [Helicobacter hepaticus ATCC 51449]|uniref:Uncharacterized protein n=1 Tax=Helicobacter hepaticus (strain ATCC 51449 / 3B1) TaxID=235279 RepID=Q7VHB4_HELHP|nr:hypothetical protein HH_1053 [Helicobacter hepaticus ATCC 51449]